MGRTSLLSTTLQQDITMANKLKRAGERGLTHVELGPERKQRIRVWRAKMQLDHTPVPSDEKAILTLVDRQLKLEKV